MMDIASFTEHLTLDAQGIWSAKSASEVSYPKDQHAACFAVEETSFWFRHRNETLLRLMDLFPPQGAMFDVGGGNGMVSKALQTAGVESVVVEPLRSGALNARQRGVSHVICASLDNAGFRPGSLPAAGLFDVLEHIEADQRFLQTLHRLMANQGRLYLTVPAYAWLWSTEDNEAGHIRRYTRATLEKSLSAAGFRMEFCSYFFSFLPLPIFLARSIPSRIGLRHTRDHARNSKEHRQDQSLFKQPLQTLMRWEQSKIAEGRAVPFGSSCIGVAVAE